eukprot:TRINITY_DN7209_c0_g1_i1.p1 TRINITY_DN7209_c0_g1~~TRINITY_DN7209_c0_g1_i1.p1  ORF type:complete len:362 (+),score=126.84 TRINITY_DN7209_c0_g1_i1:106-1191(+)
MVLESVAQLPDELILEIFSFVEDAKDLRGLQLVNSHFRRLSLDNELWKQFFCNKNELDPSSGTLWSDIFVYVTSLERSLQKAQHQVVDGHLEFDHMLHQIATLRHQNFSLTHEIEEVRSDYERIRKTLADTIEEQLEMDQELHGSKKLMNLQKLHLDEMERDLLLYQHKVSSEISKNKQLAQQIEEIEAQLNKERDANKPLRKEVAELRSMWEKEVEEIERLKLEQRKRDKQIESLMRMNHEKAKEIAKLNEKFERSAREEKMKRAVLERRLVGLNLQLTEDTESIKKQNLKNSRDTEKLKKEAELEYENVLELKRKNRELERDLKRQSLHFEQEIARIKGLLSRTNRLGSALSFQVMAKA